MAFFQWDNSYSVGVKRFDTDHQQLFQILNELNDGMKSGKGKDVLQSVLSKLMQYTQTHFAAEEAVMSQVGYPQLAAQIAQHRAFTNKTKEFAAQLQVTAVGLSVEVLDFLRDWLTQHIMQSDKQYTSFLNAKGVS